MGRRILVGQRLEMLSRRAEGAALLVGKGVWQGLGHDDNGRISFRGGTKEQRFSEQSGST